MAQLRDQGRDLAAMTGSTMKEVRQNERKRQRHRLLLQERCVMDWFDKPCRCKSCHEGLNIDVHFSRVLSSVPQNRHEVPDQAKRWRMVVPRFAQVTGDSPATDD
jgi:hypothetical protein